jgi:hypothetical protein
MVVRSDFDSLRQRDRLYYRNPDTMAWCELCFTRPCRPVSRYDDHPTAASTPEVVVVGGLVAVVVGLFVFFLSNQKCRYFEIDKG